MVLEQARKDPGIWNELHKLGWVHVSKIEAQWRALEGWKTFYRNWHVIYQKLRRALHHTDTYREFRISIIDRDGHCVNKSCESTSRLQVHHKLSWFQYPHLRLDPGNCETLCKTCHDKEPSSVASQGSYRRGR
jgi:5-methylcytosine-specific restriction endonuclease McrA